MHHDLTRAAWHKSSFSGSGNACIEVADLGNDHRAVRDSKDPTGPRLTVTVAQWSAFPTGIRAGEFD